MTLVRVLPRPETPPEVVEPAPPPQPHYVYLMSNTHGHTKIGHSSDPESRLRELMVGSSKAIEIECEWPMSREMARRVELQAHRLLEGFRVRGEWFDLPIWAAEMFMVALLEFQEDGDLDALEDVRWRIIMWGYSRDDLRRARTDAEAAIRRKDYARHAELRAEIEDLKEMLGCR